MTSRDDRCPRRFRFTQVRLLALAAVACLAAACAPRRPAVKNVLLISIDTLRADHLGSYGFPRAITPNIDAVARTGVRFKNAYSPVPVTLPAHTSMLTGTLPPVHGVRDNLNHRVPDASHTLAEILKSKGLKTAAIVSSLVLDKRFNLSQGFDSYDDRFQAVHKIGDVSERKGDETTRVATQWLTDNAREPFFLFVHYYDPHDDYEPPEPYASPWKDDLYAGEVAFADHCVGQLLAKLDALRLADQTLVVVTSDHGEMKGEHGESTHGYFVYEAALRVPLVFRMPGLKQRREVDQAVSLVDITPTIAAVMGAEAPKGVQGRDLSAWLTEAGSRPESRTLYAETFTAARYYGANALLAAIADGWKYIETTRPELYDLRKDPGETVNLLDKETARGPALARELQRLVATPTMSRGERPTLDEEAQQRLAALGYLGRGSDGEVRFDRTKEDPKDLIAFYRSDQRLNALVEAKQYDAARALCDQMSGQRPGFADCHLQMSKIAAIEGDGNAALLAARKAVQAAPRKLDARLHLAALLRLRGDAAGALDQLLEASETNPGSTEARAQLGRALIESGRFDEAVTILSPSGGAVPESAAVLTALGLGLARQGKPQEAIATYRRALTQDPNSAEAHAYLGSALASQGNFDEAMVHFDQALRVKPEHAELHDFMGVALREQGKATEALSRFREAVRLDPRLATAHMNLGRLLKQQGQAGEAATHLRRAIELNPRLAPAHNSLGSLLGAQGRVGEAIEHFRAALQAEPNDAEVHNNLGLALRMSGKRDEALAHFRAALAARPGWPASMSELAWILATHPDPKRRDPTEAVKLAERANELTGGREPAVLDALAAAHAAAGNWERAIAAGEASVALAAPRSKTQADDIARRLSLYRKRVPYRE